MDNTEHERLLGENAYIEEQVTPPPTKMPRRLDEYICTGSSSSSSSYAYITTYSTAPTWNSTTSASSKYIYYAD